MENTKTAEAQICDDIERMQSVSASEHKNVLLLYSYYVVVHKFCRNKRRQGIQGDETSR